VWGWPVEPPQLAGQGDANLLAGCGAEPHARVPGASTWERQRAVLAGVWGRPHEGVQGEEGSSPCVLVCEAQGALPSMWTTQWAAKRARLGLSLAGVSGVRSTPD